MVINVRHHAGDRRHDERKFRVRMVLSNGAHFSFSRNAAPTLTVSSSWQTSAVFCPKPPRRSFALANKSMGTQSKPWQTHAGPGGPPACPKSQSVKCGVEEGVRQTEASSWKGQFRSKGRGLCQLFAGKFSEPMINQQPLFPVSKSVSEHPAYWITDLLSAFIH
jgi:hypothetical protein